MPLNKETKPKLFKEKMFNILHTKLVFNCKGVFLFEGSVYLFI